MRKFYGLKSKYGNGAANNAVTSTHWQLPAAATAITAVLPKKDNNRKITAKNMVRTYKLSAIIIYRICSYFPLF